MTIIKKILLTIVICIQANLCFSQIVGKCTDLLGHPIPFLNVSVKKTLIGTVTNENGVFVLKEKLSPKNDSLIFSHIEYKTKTIGFYEKDTIYVIMQPSQYLLNEVVIRPFNKIFKKQKIVGIIAKTDKVTFSFTTKNLGTEIGKLFEVKKGGSYKVEKVCFNISDFGFKKASFRINFYNAVGGNNIEIVRANYSDIVKEVFNTGLVEIDVAKENLVFENDFLVSLEWIDYTDKISINPKEEKKIYFSSWVFCGPVFYIATNVSFWEKSKFKFNIGLGINLTVKY